MKKTFSFYFAHLVGKCALFGMRLLKRNASYLPGMIVLKIDPKYIAHVGQPEQMVVVTGTNGKTTVVNMVSEYLIRSGKHVMGNRLGSNTKEGIATALLDAGSLLGKARHEVGVLELDERSSIRVFPMLHADVMLVTNLFRDSHPRNAHADYIFELLDGCIPTNTKLVLNAEDPISNRLASDNDRVYFGFELQKGEREQRPSRIRDLVNCPVCQHELDVDFIRYNHIGRYHCSICGYKSPSAEYAVISYDSEKREAVLSNGTEQAVFRTPTDNIVDLYNVLSAAAVVSECGIPFLKAAEISFDLPVLKSRYDERIIGDKRLLVVLCKGDNPIAPTRIFDYLGTQPGRKVLVMANEVVEPHVVQNMAWNYDNDYTFLNHQEFRQIFCCGERYLDFALCLRLAGVPEERILLSRDYTNVSERIDYANTDLICVVHDTVVEPCVQNVVDQVASDMESMS